MTGKSKDTRTEFQKILDGDSDYCHAGNVKAVYEALCEQGNAEDFQLYVLEVIHEGIERKKEEHSRHIAAILRGKRRAG